MLPLVDIGIIAGIIVFLLMAIGLILARLYRRASKEVSFVRTGFGGQKVVLNGGALVLPVLHETIPVNMSTLRLEVRRTAAQALITRDRMRVDVTAEFYVRVQPTSDAIANAAQTLGQRTMRPDLLKELVEGKFVDALRAVAAEMAMEELHEKRANFVQKVQTVVSEDLLKNGLELESVSLTGLDQTSFEHLNPQNAFDAEGLTKLTEAIEARKKKRNDIEQDTRVAIQLKDLEAERKSLEIQREQEYARLEQSREVSVRRAAQEAEIASQNAAKKREAEEAEILARRQVDLARIEAEREVEQQEIERQQTIEARRIEQRRALEIAEQERSIAISEKSRSESEAKAEADRARAEAVKAEEEVETNRALAVAERRREIEVIRAREEAEREAVQITVGAEAEKQAADDRRAALLLIAQGEAEAEERRAEAAAKRYQVDAEGRRALNDAANVLSVEQIAMQARMALIEQLPEIIRESVKPIEAIDGIRIVHVDGLGASSAGAGAASAGEGAGTASGSLADQVVNSALRYRAQAPLLDSLLNDIGLNGTDINGLTASFRAGKETEPFPPVMAIGTDDQARASASETAMFESSIPGEEPMTQRDPGERVESGKSSAA